MSILKKIFENGGHISWHRHEALKDVINASSKSDLQLAHERVSSEIKGRNIWVAVNELGVMLSRDWPVPPGLALVSFPDQGTAIQVLEEIEASSGQAAFKAGIISYAAALESANSNRALLVMVTYDGETPHYVPVSHIGTNEEVAASGKPWWKLW